MIVKHGKSRKVANIASVKFIRFSVNSRRMIRSNIQPIFLGKAFELGERQHFNSDFNLRILKNLTKL